MRCQQRTVKGTRCTRQNTEGRFCWQHSNRSASLTGGGSKNQIKKPKRFNLPQVGSWEIYGSSVCPWTLRAVSLLEKQQPKQKVIFYDASLIWPQKDFYSGKNELLTRLQSLFGQRSDHQTMPMVFDHRNRFVGGFDDLEQKFKQ